jgi:hypothetical protein
LGCLASTSVILSSQETPAASLWISRQKAPATDILLERINALLALAHQLANSDIIDTFEDDDPDLSQITGDDMDSIDTSSSKKARPADESMEVASSALRLLDSPSHVPPALAEAIALLHVSRVTLASHVIVSGIPVSLSDAEVRDNIIDIFEHHHLPLDREQLRALLLAPPYLVNIQQDHLRNSDSADSFDGTTGSVVVPLSHECSFGDVVDPASNRFLHVLSEPGYTHKMGNGRSFVPLLHCNPVATECLGDTVNDDSLLFVVRGGTGVDATDAFLASSLMALPDILPTGPISIHTESTRRMHKVLQVSNKTSKVVPLPRYNFEIVLMVRALGPEASLGRNKEKLYDMVRSFCADGRNPNWSSEEASGVLTS